MKNAQNDSENTEDGIRSSSVRQYTLHSASLVVNVYEGWYDLSLQELRPERRTSSFPQFQKWFPRGRRKKRKVLGENLHIMTLKSLPEIAEAWI